MFKIVQWPDFHSPTLQVLHLTPELLMGAGQLWQDQHCCAGDDVLRC